MYGRDDWPFGNSDSSAALYHYARTRAGEQLLRHLADRAIPERAKIRHEKSRPLIDDLEQRQCHTQASLSPMSDPAKAMDSALNRWCAMTQFLADGRICLSSNAAECALRGIAVGHRNWTFFGSDAGVVRATAVYTLIEKAELNELISKLGSSTPSPASTVIQQRP